MFAQGELDLVPSYEVRSQSSKVAIDADGVIAMRSGYRRGGGDYWRALLDSLRE